MEGARQSGRLGEGSRRRLTVDELSLVLGDLEGVHRRDGEPLSSRSLLYDTEEALEFIVRSRAVAEITHDWMEAPT